MCATVIVIKQKVLAAVLLCAHFYIFQGDGYRLRIFRFKIYIFVGDNFGLCIFFKNGLPRTIICHVKGAGNVRDIKRESV